MKTKHVVSHRALIALAGLLALAPVAQASTVTIVGSDVELLTANNINGWVAITDLTNNGSSATVVQNKTGSLSQFDSALGVLTNVKATATIAAPRTLVKSGGAGSAAVYSSWTLGGNSASGFTASTGSSISITGEMTVTSSAGNLNNFVGSGNVAGTNNRFSTTLSASRTGNVSSVGARITPNLLYSESVFYTYLTHGNASFSSPGDTDSATIDFGAIANGASATQAFSIFDLGELGLTDFSFSWLYGDDVFGISGGNEVLAGSSSLYSAQFLAQNPSAATNFSGTYRLSF
ncbi:MAG: hypothetical protein ABI478_12415, partial [Propionivibrio sp.]